MVDGDKLRYEIDHPGGLTIQDVTECAYRVRWHKWPSDNDDICYDIFLGMSPYDEDDQGYSASVYLAYH